jgi:hypothetical protein
VLLVLVLVQVTTLRRLLDDGIMEYLEQITQVSDKYAPPSVWLGGCYRGMRHACDWWNTLVNAGSSEY